MAKHIIIGGGAIGLSTAWHLARRGVTDVLVLERNQLTSGTSWHAAGIVGPLRASLNMTGLAMYALDCFPELERTTGLSTGYRRTGGYWLARDPARMDELHRIAALGQMVGLTPKIVPPGDIAVPGLSTEGLVGALRVAEDAHVNPVDLCMAYASAARAKGVEIRENTPVTDILLQGNRAVGVRTPDREIAAETITICAGAWTKSLTDPLGVALPLQAVEHMYLVTEHMADLPVPFPVLRDLDRGIYLKGDVGKLVFGAFEPNAKPWDATGPYGDRAFLELPEDWDQFAPYAEAATRLFPALETTGIQHFMNGPESFTTDNRPLIGQAPNVDALFVAAGMNSVGIMSSAGVGRLLADWIAEGAAPHDAWDVDLARADPLASAPDHMVERMKEAVSDTFAIHWPFKQPTAGRNLRRSALHDQWAAEGAHFGVTAGWERGLWYGPPLPYSVGDQPWWPHAQAEAQAMLSHAAMIDLSPFTKIDVTGPDALALLQWLCCADIAPLHRAVYTQMLNPKGGIEADVTVTRFDDRFRITSGAATRWKDMAFFRRAAAVRNVTLTDQTEEEAVIGVMGPASATILSALGADLSEFAFASVRPIRVAGHPVTATRISFVGEQGWELSMPVAQAPAVHAALKSAGCTPLGHFALDGCRLEKGYKHWGHDLGPDLSPLQAGLGFCIDWSKEFQGRKALETQRKEGVGQRLVLFHLPDTPLILHDEPIWHDGCRVGLTTSGGLGPRTGMMLAFGIVDCEGLSRADTLARTYQVQVAGQLYPALPLANPPYDPTGERMRS